MTTDKNQPKPKPVYIPKGGMKPPPTPEPEWVEGPQIPEELYQKLIKKYPELASTPKGASGQEQAGDQRKP